MTTFTKIIHAIRTTTVGELENVIKQVEWSMVGERDGQSFALAQKSIIADPEPSVFITLDNVTPENLEQWIGENEPNMIGIQAHIELVLERMVLEASLEPQTLPWTRPE